MRYVFDVDGTLCFNGILIDQLIIDALKELEQNGHELFFASARPIRDLLPVIGEFKESKLIGGNGSIIAENGTITVTRAIDHESYAAILSLIKRYGLSYIIDDAWNYAAEIASGHPVLKQLDPDHLAEKIALEKIAAPIKIILLDLPAELYATIYQELQKNPQLFLITHNQAGNIDITAKNINKFTTLTNFFPAAEYIAFGNDHNDIDLLRHAQVSYFVGEQTFCEPFDLTPDYFLPQDSAQIAAAIKNF